MTAGVEAMVSLRSFSAKTSSVSPARRMTIFPDTDAV